MQRVFPALLALCLLLPACGKSSPHEALADEATASLENLVTVLEGATDEASAKASLPKLEQAITRMKEVETRMKAMEKPTAEQEAAMEARHKGKVDGLTGRMTTQMMRIATDPKLSAVLAPALDKFGK